MEILKTGIVVENYGNEYLVFSDGAHYLCRLKGKFKIKGLRTTNPVAIGDVVDFRIGEQSALDGECRGDGRQSYIHQIHPRRNYMIRRSINLSKEAHILGANLDRTLLIVTLAYPETPLIFIDRYLATAEAYNVEAALVFNKVDLYDDKLRKRMEDLLHLYRGIGYRCFPLSASEGVGLSSVRDYISNGITLLSGQSGVGKSSLINALIPGVDLKTAKVSKVHNAGVHTTTYSSMIPYGNMLSTYLIDTPGIKGFGTIDFNTNEVGHYFPEIFKHSEQCRFSNCTHTHEPHCAVQVALNEGQIATSRYKSYLSILQDQEESKYREAY